MIFCPPMNGGLQTNASNPARSMKTSGNSSGQWNDSDPRLSQTLPRFSLQLFGGEILELVLRRQVR